jgi:predicted DNA-binding mobile mystery protein A
MSSSNVKRAPDRALARLRLDSRLNEVRAQRTAMQPPHGGWLRAVRSALGMSLEDLAARLGTTRSSMARLEASEQKETIQLDTLRRAAQALNCELAYVLIPKLPLQETVDTQRLKVARQHSSKVRTHMSLEDQDTKDTGLERWREERALSLVRDRDLWKLAK